eukprot:939009-Pelagomonas_calceolata.AAC.1
MAEGTILIDVLHAAVVRHPQHLWLHLHPGVSSLGILPFCFCKDAAVAYKVTPFISRFVIADVKASDLVEARDHTRHSAAFVACSKRLGKRVPSQVQARPASQPHIWYASKPKTESNIHCRNGSFLSPVTHLPILTYGGVAGAPDLDAVLVDGLAAAAALLWRRVTLLFSKQCSHGAPFSHENGEWDGPCGPPPSSKQDCEHVHCICASQAAHAFICG